MCGFRLGQGAGINSFPSSSPGLGTEGWYVTRIRKAIVRGVGFNE